jgi:uncharacterized protein Usg
MCSDLTNSSGPNTVHALVHNLIIFRSFSELDVTPEFPMLKAAQRLWSKLQAGQAATDDLQDLLHCVRCTARALDLQPASTATDALLGVRC